jgi:hypothetical protein
MAITKIVFFLKLVIAIFLLGMGIYIVIYPEIFNFLQKGYTIAFGIILILRGLFRIYFTYKNDWKAKQ